MYRTLSILGLLIIIGPFLFGYSGDPFALGTHVLTGLLLLLFLAREMVVHDRERWEYWLISLLGFALIGMPFLLGFSSITTALWMGTVSGMLLVILSAIKLVMPQNTKPTHHATTSRNFYPVVRFS